MNPPVLLGITGGIGSGKSTICSILEAIGFPVYYADDRAKWLMNHDDQLKRKILRLFGKNSYNQSGLNRTYVAQVVFEDQSMLSKLNELVHPSVAKDFDLWVSQQKRPLVAKEAALLFETGSFKDLTSTWLITCPEDIRIGRVAKRDTHRTKEAIQSIIDKQWSDEKKKKLADLEIVNDGKTAVLETVLTAVGQLIG